MVLEEVNHYLSQLLLMVLQNQMLSNHAKLDILMLSANIAKLWLRYLEPNLVSPKLWLRQFMAFQKEHRESKSSTTFILRAQQK
jgi:hypothetical protein